MIAQALFVNINFSNGGKKKRNFYLLERERYACGRKDCHVQRIHIHIISYLVQCTAPENLCRVKFIYYIRICTHIHISCKCSLSSYMFHLRVTHRYREFSKFLTVISFRQIVCESYASRENRKLPTRLVNILKYLLLLSTDV